MITPGMSDLVPYRARVSRTLSRHFTTAPVQWALKVLDRDVFGFHSTQGLRAEFWTQDKLAALKATGVEPVVVLARIVECYALSLDRPNLFPSPKTWFAWLARRVLTVGRMSVLPRTIGATQLSHCGRVIADALGGFAVATLARSEKDEADRAAFKASCSAFVKA